MGACLRKKSGSGEQEGYESKVEPFGLDDISDPVKVKKKQLAAERAAAAAESNGHGGDAEGGQLSRYAEGGGEDLEVLVRVFLAGSFGEEEVV